MKEQSRCINSEAKPAMNPIMERAAFQQKKKKKRTRTTWSWREMYDVTVRFPLVRYSKLVDLHIQIWPLKELGILKTQQSVEHNKKLTTRQVEKEKSVTRGRAILRRTGSKQNRWDSRGGLLSMTAYTHNTNKFAPLLLCMPSFESSRSCK
jgi:hypothetical protein